MLKRLNKRYNIIRYYFLFILYLNALLFTFIICEDSTCANCHGYGNNDFFENIESYYNENNCNLNCRFSVRHKKWFYCFGIDSSSSKYYYIDGDNNCKLADTCQLTISESYSYNADKVVLPTNECIQSCSSIDDNIKEKFYELGDFCLYDSYFNNNFEKYEKITINGLTLLKCKDCTYIIEKDKSNFHQCINCNDCPTSYYDDEEKKCVSDCNNKKYMEIGNGKYKCRSECENSNASRNLDNESSTKKMFEYIETNTDNTETKTFCLDKCPENSKFYYEIGNKPRKCLEGCNEKHFHIEGGNKCTTSCDGNILYWKEDSNNFFTCKNGNGRTCPSHHPYIYYNTCLKSCSDTKLDIFFKKTTYSVIKEDQTPNKYECVDKCESSPYIYIYKETCVKDCQKTNYKYTYNFKCYEKCPSGYELYTDDKLECVDKCKDDYYELDGICYKGKCPENSYKPFTNDNNECVACNNKEKEFYKDNNEFKCYNSCPDGFLFHYFDNNICYDSSDSGKKCKDVGPKLYPYYSDDNPYICYSSCKEISSEYIYENDYLCSKEFECNNYYYEYNGMTICLNDDSFYHKKCSKIGYNYLRGKECVADCYENEYTINYQESIYEGIYKLGKCCLDPSNCDTIYIYYSKTEKILRDNCPYKRIMNDLNDNLDETITSSTDGNCVLNCPSDYPYETEIDNKKVCIKKCPNFYYYDNEDHNTLKCTTDCKSIGKYHFNNSYECIEKCVKKLGNNIINFYYDPDTNICYSKCDDVTGKEFSLNATELQSPQKCLEFCPPENNYYFENEKICLKNCDSGFYKEKNSHICLYKCAENEKVIDGNICNKNCEGNQLFFIPKQINDGSSILKCVSSCSDEDSRYKFYHNDTLECLIDCPLEAKYKMENGNICYTQCPEGYYIESDMYCKAKCDKFYQKVESEGKNIKYECVNNCNTNQFISSSSFECVDICPIGENFIGANRYCKNKCNFEDGYYYRFLDKPDNNDNNLQYKIYQCHNSIKEEEYFVYGSNETVSDCPDDKPYKSEKDKTCYDICNRSQYYPFSNEIEEGNTKKKICSMQCEGENSINYGEDKKCVNGCSSFLINKIINEEDNSCVSHCNLDSLYKFETTKNEKLFCSKECDSSEPKYSTQNYKCFSKCKYPNNYVLGNECLEKCPDKYFSEEIDNEFICKEKCNNTEKLYYYKTDLECRQGCLEDDYIIQDTYECTSFCNSTGIIKYYYYEPKVDGDNSITQRTCVTKCPNNKPYLRENNHCDEHCNEKNYNYYFPENYTCISNCPKDKKTLKRDVNLNIYECIDNCPLNYYTDTNNNCTSSCNDSIKGYKYYVPSERICLPKCNETLYYTDGYECLTSCKEGHYSLNKICVEKCPSYKKYFIDEFTHGESITQKECLFSCNNEYPFLKIDKDGDSTDENSYLYKCMGSCDYYKNQTEPKECVDECKDNYKFYILDNQGRHACLESCPDNYFYLEEEYENNNNIKCYEECPQDTYKKINSFICVKDCETKIIDYENRECVYGCKESQKYWSKDSNNIKYCLKKCNNELGPYLTNEGECVKSCNGNNYIINSIDPLNKKCVCKNLYYIENGQTICLNPEITKCGEGQYEEYKYRIYDSFQCSKYCFGLLSPDEDICYLSYDNCNHIPNTEKSIKDGKLKCDCKYRFYINENKKICLGENEECSVEPYIYYNSKDKECVPSCGNLFEYDYNCLEKCPEGTTNSENSKICKYEYNWYKEGDNNYHILPKDINCPKNYPYLIYETRECVDNCTKTKYSSIYKDICYSSCEAINNFSLKKIKPSETSKYYGKASYECQCLNIWYKDENNDINCTSSEEQECPDKFNYKVKETNECVKSCPDDYPYYFNGECFKSCTNNGYQLNIKEKGDSNECVCENLWRYNKDDNNRIIICIKDAICESDELLINDTNECYKGTECPNYSPLKFNERCYNNCPENTKQNISNTKECICKNLWYEQSNGNKYCINKCPYETHPYQIDSNKKCITDNNCPQDMFDYNYICYDNCPDETQKEDNDSKKCICNPTFGFWWYTEEENRIKLNCGKSKCPEGKDYYKNDSKECLSSCIDNNLYEYNKICYEDKCPDPTVSENVKTNKYNCIIKKYATATNIYDLYKYLKEEIVELYQSVPKGGITYTNFSSTMQVYGLNKNNSDSKDLILRSSLSYIDISSCTDKVYENNKMKNNEDIIVVKYDLGNQTEKSLVKPVEYEFVSSKTGQILDMTVCTKEDIIISYSLSNILNYNKKNKGRKLEENDDNKDIDNIMLEIQKQYNKGKDIYMEYNLDSFNINSTLYTDMCYSFELDGKDLVLEDRVKYLYPYYSLCEENCTYSHIDFDLERIFCNCPLKNELNLKRDHQYLINTYNKEDIKSKQKGPTNLPVMTCMSRLKEKKSITKNGGFFFSLILLIIEFFLLLICIFYNYPIIKNKISKNVTKNNEEVEKVINIETIENLQKENNKKKKMNKYELTYKTSERSLEYPPKKKHKDDEIDPNDIKLETKVITDANEIDNKKIDGTETDDPRLDAEHSINSVNNSFSKDYQLGILDAIQKEYKLLRLNFGLAIQKDKSDIFIMLLTEVCDKIYLIKILCLLGKYDMFTIHFSAYILYHLLLLTFVTFFYDIKTIQNIWNKENYPNLNYDLGYGLIACIIVWVIYKIFLCLLNNENIIKKYIKDTNNKSNSKKFNNLLNKIKTGMIVYFIIEFILGILCLLYLTTFCAVYTGTKKKIFKTYGIALVEVLIIKIIYGIILGILRKVGLSKKKRVVYEIVYYFDKLIH